MKPFKFCKSCLTQILIGPFLNTLSHFQLTFIHLQILSSINFTWSILKYFAQNVVVEFKGKGRVQRLIRHTVC